MTESFGLPPSAIASLENMTIMTLLIIILIIFMMMVLVGLVNGCSFTRCVNQLAVMVS
jgi:hypothetical protein